MDYLLLIMSFIFLVFWLSNSTMVQMFTFLFFTFFSCLLNSNY